MHKLTALFISTLFGVTTSYASQITVKVFSADGNNKPMGQVVFKDSNYGLLINPELTSLPAGLHGFHLHQHANCGDHGTDAGAHFDPKNTNSHQGPYGQGHLGDLPALYVDSTGLANTPILAPRLKTSDLHGLAVMIHAGGDNYSNTPPLGGGGARIACGVIKP